MQYSDTSSVLFLQDDWDQPRALWEKMSEKDKTETLSNIAGHIQGAQEFIQKRAIELFGKIHQEMADGLVEKLSEKKKSDEPYTMTA